MTLSASTELIAFSGNTPPVSDWEKCCSQSVNVALRFLPGTGIPARKAKGPHPPAFYVNYIIIAFLRVMNTGQHREHDMFKPFGALA